LHKIVLLLFGATFAVMIWGVSLGGWWMAEMSGLFLFAGIGIGVVGRLGEKGPVEAFVGGARDLLGVALIIGLARGIVVVMDAGHITDTILHWAEGTVAGLNRNRLHQRDVLDSGGRCRSSFPRPRAWPSCRCRSWPPSATFAGVSRSLVVTAFQSAEGVVNLVTPTSAVVMGGLAIGRVPYERWLRFVWPVLLGLTIIIMAALSLGVLLQGTPA
jgi:uncharacterized ion transporter superfamily protein YfcC